MITDGGAASEDNMLMDDTTTKDVVETAKSLCCENSVGICQV